MNSPTDSAALPPMAGSLSAREKYLTDRGWKRHSQNLWVDPRNGSLCPAELAHLHAKERRSKNVQGHAAGRGVTPPKP